MEHGHGIYLVWRDEPPDGSELLGIFCRLESASDVARGFARQWGLEPSTQRACRRAVWQWHAAGVGTVWIQDWGTFDD